MRKRVPHADMLMSIFLVKQATLTCAEGSTAVRPGLLPWQVSAEQVDNTLKDSIDWYLDDPQAADPALNAEMYHEFALGDHIGKLGAHGAHADAAEKEVLVGPKLLPIQSYCDISGTSSAASSQYCRERGTERAGTRRNRLRIDTANTTFLSCMQDQPL